MSYMLMWKTFLVVGDTPWSIPFRATTGQVKEYAADRMKKGLKSEADTLIK